MNPLKVDPARLSMVRRPFLADIRRRFAKLKKEITKALVDDDILGLTPPEPLKLFGTAKVTTVWDGVRINAGAADPERLKKFQEWLRARVESGEIELDSDNDWTSPYIKSSYKKGVLRAYLQASKNPKYRRGTKEQYLAQFNAGELFTKVQMLATKTYTGIKGVTKDLESTLQVTLAKGMIEGRSTSSIASEISERLDISRGRAERIARTEIMYAHAEGQLDSLQMLGVGETRLVAEFTTAQDDRVCPKCLALEGKLYKLSEARGVIPVHPNCVVGSSVIESPSALGIIRAKFTGKIIEIVTSEGGSLSVTENHVMLTQRGWVRAGNLTDSDYLVHTSALDPNILSGPNNNQTIPCIADLESAANKMLLVTDKATSNPAPEDFHGDGKSFDGEVHVSRLNSLLWDESSSVFAQLEKGSFVVRTESSGPFNRLSVLSLLLQRAAAAADSFMGFDSVSSVFFRGSSAHGEPVCFGLTSQPDSSRSKPCCHHYSSKPVVFSEFIDRQPGLVALDNLIKIFSRNLGSSCPSENRTTGLNKTAFFNFLSECLFHHPEFKGCLENRYFRRTEITGNRIVNCSSRYVHSLDVYDLETMETAYSVNGFISSNCRCIWQPAPVK
jgi:SPP1 gp7 family putative phage head morphogenesis protein